MLLLIYRESFKASLSSLNQSCYKHYLADGLAFGLVESIDMSKSISYDDVPLRYLPIKLRSHSKFLYNSSSVVEPLKRNLPVIKLKKMDPKLKMSAF